ncbi:MAG: AraC family transcriptional regulator, partial [Bacteroidota bacterium]
MNIAIFQGALIGFVLLRSQFFKNTANRYLAYAILALSWSLLNLVLDLTEAFARYPLLEIVDAVDSVFLFPVFILLFVVHQVDHPLANSRKLAWLFAPYLLSLVVSCWGEFDPAALAAGHV